MPTISIGRDRLFAALGESYSQEEFEDLCFRFGIELDDVTTEKAIIRKEKHIDEEADDDEEIIYKIEIPANRYDLLCLEGLAQALRVFNGKQEIPTYSLSNISKDKILKMKVKPETSKIRPFVVCAVLRGVTFDEARYNSFIDLQDKLHQNICRRRTLVAIGTHDLDTLQGPFTYEALQPTDINFVPLKQTKSFRADELIEFYKVTRLLTQMQLHAEQAKSTDNQCAIKVHVPPNRSDVLHPCDVMEDVAIAYGFNNIPTRSPASIKPLPLNELTDLLRTEIAMNVYTEVVTWLLCSRKENFEMLNREDDNSAVIIENPRSADFEAMRRTLMPGILKTVGSNKDHPKPIKIYEISDVAMLDESKDVGASNRRHLAALHCGATSGFELIHGLVDRIMEVMAIPFVPIDDSNGYYIKLSQEPEFLPGRQASIVVRGKQIGNFGIVHPQVLNNFDITDPCSFVEIDIEALL